MNRRITVPLKGPIAAGEIAGGLTGSGVAGDIAWRPYPMIAAG